MIIRRCFSSITCLILCLLSLNVFELKAQTNEPLFNIQNLKFEGAFIIPGGQIGESRSDYCMGTIEYNSANHSLFLAGKANEGAIAEFSIPELVMSDDILDLNTAATLQAFKSVLSLTPDANPQNIDRITGMLLFDDRLIVNGLEYYDAPANNTHTTLLIENPDDLANATVNGYYTVEGAAHFAGGISPVPPAWQGYLQTEYISGESSRLSINGRLAMGIPAFGFEPADIIGTPSGIIPTEVLMDYDLAEPLFSDYSHLQNADYNKLSGDPDPLGGGHTAASINFVAGDNDLWTSESSAPFSFIVPGTSTLLSIGHSGGHESGIGYKAMQSDGNICGGPCPFDADDNYNYYWLWDLEDLLAVKNGTLLPHEVRPYDYGIFEVPYQTDVYTNTPEFHQIVGGTFDPDSNILYLTIYDGGATGAYRRNPVIAAYKIIQEEICDGLDNNGDGNIDEHLINTWVGPTAGDWNESTSYWSLCHFPNSCNQVVIPPGNIISIQSGKNGLAYSLALNPGSELFVKDGANLHVEKE